MKMNQDIKARWVAALRSGEYAGMFLHDLAVSDFDRWLESVEVQGECWQWTGAKNSDGYPYTNLRSDQYRGNRLFWMLENRRLIPPDKAVCHSCDNRACVNPAHLWLGSLTENNRDRAQKGRNRDQSGTRNNQAKLTDEKVANIRSRYRAGGIFQRELAAEFGVTQTMVGRIVRGDAWRHVGEAQL